MGMCHQLEPYNLPQNCTSFSEAMALDLLEDGKPEEISEELKARLKSSYSSYVKLHALNLGDLKSSKITLIRISANMSTPDFCYDYELNTYGSWPFLAWIFFGATA